MSLTLQPPSAQSTKNIGHIEFFLHFFFIENSQHIDYGNWESLSDAKISDLFAMEIFYIELKIASNLRDEAAVKQPR